MNNDDYLIYLRNHHKLGQANLVCTAISGQYDNRHINVTYLIYLYNHDRL